MLEGNDRISMKISFEESLRLISRIPHKNCQKGKENYWVQYGADDVTVQSICWLFCWAKITNKHSEPTPAAQEARYVFNQIFNRPYEWFDEQMSHETAQWLRYAKGDCEEWRPTD